MATVRDLIEDAFREAGVLGLGQTMKAEDYQLALRRLNGMIGQWNKKRWLTFHLTNKTIVSKGITGYTIGPTGDIVVTERPDKVYSASYQGRQVLGSFSNDFDDDFNIQARTDDGDVPLQIIRSREDYNQIRRKRQSGQPMTLFYEPSFPLGVFYLYPVPPLNSVNIIAKLYMTAL